MWELRGEYRRVGEKRGGLVAAREREAKWKSKAEWWKTAPTSGDAGWDIPKDDPCCQE
jgi:hypothetical protein